MQPPDQLVEYARQIAIYRGYDNLESGLQPLDVLQTKYKHEVGELAEAVAIKDIWHQYHEAADLLYYAACMTAQLQHYYGEPYNDFGYYNAFEIIRFAGLNPESAQQAALAKYGWRSAAPGNKDEEYEIKLIKEEIAENK
jgi:NTP pyrophosphatase (non-canonical NTP hydrolase)